MRIHMSASAPEGRPEPLHQLYCALSDLNTAIDGPYYLNDCSGGMDFPEQGVYFFFSSESDLEHGASGTWQLTRIGTIGVSEGSSATLWGRLRQHRGNASGKYADGGNHRGSVFRKHVGRALIERDDRHGAFPHWGQPHAAGLDIETTALREQEHPLEQEVSEYIGNLPFLYLNVPGEPGPNCDRAQIEMNAIAMTSHYRRQMQTPYRSASWLGRHSPAEEIYRTGLWNIEHVSALFSQAILETMRDYIDVAVPA
jgi:hypothetical protein